MISHYEVFERKNTPVCIDFENRIYSDTEFKETYPKSNSFGIWAWTANSLENEQKRVEFINKRILERV